MEETHLIGEGTHGCAFTPPLPCKKSKTKKSRTVGKIIDKAHADIELKVATIVKGIPGWHRYFIVQEEDQCEPKNFRNQREQHEAECKILQATRNRNLTQLLSPYGGSTLHSIAITSSFDFLGSMKHLLEAISHLQGQGLCHYDLKDNNMVIDGVGTLRIIDFGSAFLGDHVSEKNIWKHQYSFLPEYPPQPPELAVQNGLYEGIGFRESISETIRQKRIFKSMERLLGVSVERITSEMEEFWMEDPSWKGDTWVPFFHKFWRVWDSWAVGIIYMRLLEKSLLLPSFAPIWAEHGPLIRSVLKGLLEVDPRKRLSGVEAAGMLRFY